jgi:hypothetical protein
MTRRLTLKHQVPDKKIAKMKEDCIEKICSLPLNFNKGDKSVLALLNESQFLILYKEINVPDIIDYLQKHVNLIDIWKRFSENKRTSGGFYYSTNYIGSLSDSNFDKTFTSDIEACAEYILKEISRILFEQ